MVEKIFVKKAELNKKFLRRFKCTENFHLDARLGYILYPLLPVAKIATYQCIAFQEI